MLLYVWFFFFQAEDGIRDFHVTGVQTCALPISSGSAMRNASASAAPTHTGSERSSVIARRSRSEELHEPLLDLLVALEQLGWIHAQELQVGELRLVGGILHAGVAGVEAFAVGEELLQLATEAEVGEEPGRV